MRQARLVLCCLDGERLVGKDDNSVLASSDRYLTGSALRNCCASTFTGSCT